jgi:hypothetical protein
MGFWKTLGKIGLKVAPYAAMAIPGVGIPLGMAIAGGLGTANAKVSGQSWGKSLLSGGIDAGLSGVGAGALKGIGPTSGTAAKILKGATGGGEIGKVGVLGKALGDTGIGALKSQISKPTQQTPEGSVINPSPSIGPTNPPSMNPPSGGFTPMNSPSLADSIAAGRQKARLRYA